MTRLFLFSSQSSFLNMRNLSAPPNPNSRRGSYSNLGATPTGPPPLAHPNQGRYKGLLSTPGIVKFSAWKREVEIPK